VAMATLIYIEVEALRNTTKIWVDIIGVPTEFRTGHLLKRSKKCTCLYCKIQKSLKKIINYVNSNSLLFSSIFSDRQGMDSFRLHHMQTLSETHLVFSCTLDTPRYWGTVAARSKARTVFACPNTGIMGSNPTQGMDVCLRLFCVCAVLCAGSGFVTCWSPVQRVLPTV
jgi:hypothetical protein